MKNNILKKINLLFIGYKNLSLPVKASIWFIVCNCILKSVQIITTPIYTRILSTSQYGEYTVFLSWIELVAIFTTLDIFYSGYNVGMEKFKKDREKYTSAMHGLCITITTIWLVVCLIFSEFFTKIMGISTIHLIILILYMYIYPIFQFWSARKKYNYEYKSLIIATFLIALITIVLGTIASLIFKEKSTAVIIAKVIAETIISIPLFFSTIKSFKSLYNKYYWKYALKFNIPLIPHYISTMILNHSDRIMILNMCSSSEAGIYSVAYSIAMLITIIQNAINNAFVPWLYNKISKKDYNNITKFTSYIIFGEAFLNLLLILIAPEVINILSTKEYFEARWIIPPVTFGIFLTGIYGLFVNIELYYEKNKITAFSSMIVALINLILNYIFIKKYGYLAAGYTTFVSYLLLTVIHWIGICIVCNNKKLKINYFFETRKILMSILFFAIFAGFIMFLYQYFVIRYCLVIIALLFAIINKSKIINVIKKIKNK